MGSEMCIRDSNNPSGILQVAIGLTKVLVQSSYRFCVSPERLGYSTFPHASGSVSAAARAIKHISFSKANLISLISASIKVFLFTSTLAFLIFKHCCSISHSSNKVNCNASYLSFSITYLILFNFLSISKRAQHSNLLLNKGYSLFGLCEENCIQKKPPLLRGLLRNLIRKEILPERLKYLCSEPLHHLP